MAFGIIQEEACICSGVCRERKECTNGADVAQHKTVKISYTEQQDISKQNEYYISITASQHDVRCVKTQSLITRHYPTLRYRGWTRKGNTDKPYRRIHSYVSNKIQ